MPIKKLSKFKRLSKSKKISKSRTKSRTKKLLKSKPKPKYNYNNKKKMSSQKRSNKNYNKKVNNKGLIGGFAGDSNCNIATVKESGFNIAGFGTGPTAMAGLSIPETRAMIYNPSCSNSTNKYQAMVPG